STGSGHPPVYSGGSAPVSGRRWATLSTTSTASPQIQPAAINEREGINPHWNWRRSKSGGLLRHVNVTHPPTIPRGAGEKESSKTKLFAPFHST
uniref:Uncharacterized protein n=1 Tax=Triticum urartu TaxID=4572 RepID=A0A8R7QHH9_TRIUA